MKTPGGHTPNPMRSKQREEAQMQNVQQVRQALAQYVGANETEFEDAVCECGSRHYNQYIRKKRVSGMHPSNPFQPNEQFIDLVVMVCAECKIEMKIGGPQKNVTFEMVNE